MIHRSTFSCNICCSTNVESCIIGLNMILTTAFQLFSTMFLITLRAFVSSISFTLHPEEKFKCTSRDFGFSKKLGSMPKLGDSSSSLLMSWSLNNNGRFAGLFTASQQSVDSSPHSLSPAFRLFSVADPEDFASLLNRKISSGSWFSLLYSWPLSFDFIKFSCGTLMFLWMNFNRSAAFLIFDECCED